MTEASAKTQPSPEEMRALGRRLAEVLRHGDVVVLSGPLGAGKTTLAQGIGAGLGVRGPVTSPTFVIARVHRALEAGRPALVHADGYRLGGHAELDDLDLDADLDSSVTRRAAFAGVPPDHHCPPGTSGFGCRPGVWAGAAAR